MNIVFVSAVFLMIYYIYEIIKEEKDLFYNIKKENSDLLDQIILMIQNYNLFYKLKN